MNEFTIFILTFGLLFGGLSHADEREAAAWVLGKGEQRVLRIKGGLRKYSLGGACVRARSLPASRQPSGDPADILLVKAVCPGYSDLWITTQQGESIHRRIRVVAIVPQEVPPALARALGELDESEVLFVGSGVVLRGEIRDARELSRIRSLSASYPKEVSDETVPSDLLVAEGRARIESWIHSNSFASGLKLERQGHQLFVRGSLGRPSLRNLAEQRLRSLYPAAVLELDSMPDTAPTVYFRVFLLELRKSRFKSLGLSWPPFQEGAFRVTSSGIESALQLDLTLKMLEGDGSVRILSNPELVVRAPGEAELFAGGELPIRTKSQYQSMVLWKNFGLTLHLKVTHSSGERVRLDIQTEVSQLDSSIALDQIPGIQANRMKTQVDARYGVPLLLSGLLQQGMREQARGLPLLYNLPVLGKLFGSEDYLNERSELVAILLPASAPPSSPMERIASSSARAGAPATGVGLALRGARVQAIAGLALERIAMTPDWLSAVMGRPEVTDICLNGAFGAFVDAGSGMERIQAVWTEEEMKAWVLQEIAQAGKSWDARHPFIDATLASGHRLHVAFPPLARQGILISLRRLPTASGTRTHCRWEGPAYERLCQAARDGDSILIAGATGSGKTTLATDLLAEVPAHERILALEDTPELTPAHPHFVSLTTRPPNADGFGEVTLRSLLRQALRMRPDRIVLGECRGGETLDLLQALNTGHRGAMATLHAGSPRDALRRIELLCLLGGAGTVPLAAIRELLACGVDWVAQVRRSKEGRREISELWHVEGREGETVLMRPLYPGGVLRYESKSND